MLQFEPIWEELMQISDSFRLDHAHRLNLLLRDSTCLLEDFLQFREEFFLSSLTYADSISQIVNSQDQSIDITYRYKEEPSIIRNWGDVTKSTQRLKNVLNDLLGFRFVFKLTTAELDIIVDQFITETPSGYTSRKVFLESEGYQGIHIYITKDNYSFPIEVQFWTRTHALLNRYLRDNIYAHHLGEDIQKYAQNLREWLENIPILPPTAGLLSYIDYIYEKAFVSPLTTEEERANE